MSWVMNMERHWDGDDEDDWGREFVQLQFLSTLDRFRPSETKKSCILLVLNTNTTY